jgi:hypothetical protein
MADKLACLTAIWALLVAPGLCRYGVLQACCVPAPAHDEAAADVDDCCKTKHSPAREAPKPRDCGSCAHVCDAAVQAPSDDHPIEIAQALLLPVTHDTALQTARPVHVFALDNALASRSERPYPPSDIPLLI